MSDVALLSSDPRERTALAALCECRDWTVARHAGLRDFARVAAPGRFRVVVVRHRLADGLSEEALRLLAALPAPRPRVVVLLAGATPAAVEARQLLLGADCVLRDPVRAEVFSAYLAKYLAFGDSAPSPRAAAPLRFAGGTFEPAARLLRLRGRTIRLTPRETALARTLAANAGRVVDYETLYGTVLDRPFRGDTGNMRVLLGKLTATLAAAGTDLRRWIEVIPKTGYRYRPPHAPARPPAT